MASMTDFLNRIFKRTKSKDNAKKRLQIVLMHDRKDISPEIMAAIREDILKVISKYMDVDNTGIDIDLNDDENMVALEVSVPVKGMKRASTAIGRVAEKNNA
ncbi:MAG: cell division topological specificity factor MinE [Pyramidobacter porci]|nr:cell division topological specificity factor MinE [Pyramidobacter porci]MDY2648623.1 cell division topological specificity factor MinE [Pyramidobacter porci]